MITNTNLYQKVIEYVSHDATYLVSITAYASDSLEPEVEYITRKVGAFKEGDYEASKATINMQADVILLCELGQSRDVVHVAIRKVHGRPDDLWQHLNMRILSS